MVNTVSKDKDESAEFFFLFNDFFCKIRKLWNEVMNFSNPMSHTHTGTAQGYREVIYFCVSLPQK